ncbi:helix-turn-helix domain-containing protein [Aureispira anguillae]|uniref:Helix-turn-helix domain-containing protein n=1 Tax=Aureispira anguillae TaxID=2864201 RepID=A0A916DS79_9BACT|nr:helix-turn-helix transcriptional regulator [Aureispira anguillae]BDS10887.1 helix-turn-helix domain-containing protein [Aureispira anguillae]
MSVNERFTQLIKTLSFTPNSLSKELNVTQPTIKKLEKGETLPNAKVLIPLLERFNVNINWLLGGEGEMFLNSSSSRAQEMIGGTGPDSNLSSNSRNSTCTNVKFLQKEIQYLNDKLKDKEEIIRLMRNQK